MNNYNIVALPPTLVEVLWDKIVPHLERVIPLANNEVTLEGVKASIRRRYPLLRNARRFDCRGPFSR